MTTAIKAPNPAALVKRRIRARRARQAANETQTAVCERPRPTRQLPEMPDCLKNRKPGEILRPEQTIEVLDWMAECVRDAATRAGLRV